MLAQQEKGPQAPANFPFTMDYGYHFNSGLLGEYLSELAVERGVTHVQARIVDVEQDPDGDAEIELRTFLGMLESDQEARHLEMRVGQLDAHWQRNCIGLGLSQGFIEPLEATALLLVQISIELFIAKYEAGGFSAQHREEFNQKVDDRFERVRDYIVAHYKLNTRDDSEYWKANRENMELSPSLRHILDVWYRRGDLTEEIQRQNIESHFGTLSWHCMLSGYGALPPLAEEQPGKGDLYEDQGVQQFLAGCALNFNPHEQNLAGLRGPDQS